MIRTNIAVLGGGLSGLAAACALEEAHADYILFERRPELGGFTRTAKVGDFCFDYTGHFLHLARYSSPARVPYANLRDEDWMLIPRKACCYVANSMVTAPLQYHLGELPQDVLEKCAKSYDERLSEVRDTPRNFKEYLVHSFGRSVAELFLIPQNEKTLATSVDRLSVRAVRRFFPVADDAVIRRGMKKQL